MSICTNIDFYDIFFSSVRPFVCNAISIYASRVIKCQKKCPKSHHCHHRHHHPERETIMPIIILLITQGDCLQFETAWNPFWTIFSQYWMRETLPPPLLVWKESPISSIYWPQTSAESDQRSPQLTRGKNDVCPSCTRTLHPSPNIALHWPSEPSMPLIILLQPKEVEGLKASCLPSVFVFFSAEIYIYSSTCVKHSLKLGTTHNHTALPKCPTLPWFILQFPMLPHIAERCPTLPYVALQDSPYSARATE